MSDKKGLFRQVFLAWFYIQSICEAHNPVLFQLSNEKSGNLAQGLLWNKQYGSHIGRISFDPMMAFAHHAAMGFGYRMLSEAFFIGSYIHPTCFYAGLCNPKHTFWEVNTGFEYAQQNYQVTLNTCWRAFDQTPYFYNYRDKGCGGSLRVSGYPFKQQSHWWEVNWLVCCASTLR